MKYEELKKYINDGGYDTLFAELYPERNIGDVKKRYASAVESFCALFGDGHDMFLFSSPSRTEICGNHTDHNGGKVCAASVDLDIIAVAAKNDINKVTVKSEGFPADECVLSDISPDKKYYGRSLAFVRGVADGFVKNNHNIGGFYAYTTSDIPVGAGLSTSAAFSNIVAEMYNHFYNDGKITAVDVAKISKYAENVHFGKPSGLMDQIACAVGGFVSIDFADSANPVVTPMFFDIKKYGYSMYIVDTGSGHEDLTDEYAAIPREMKSVAALFGKQTLCGITKEELYENFENIRNKCGDRAFLRAYHFVNENKRVENIIKAIKTDDIETFLSIIRESGDSSAKYLQNSYPLSSTRRQSVTVALALAQDILQNGGAWRVHGGGFAGTIQAFVKNDCEEKFCRLFERTFGQKEAKKISIRKKGCICIGK